MRKITFLSLAICLIFTHLTVGYTQDADLETLRAADVNADGVINILDLTLVAAHFGTTPAADQAFNPDVNADNIVNILDLTFVARHIGKTVRTPVAFVRANPAAHSELAVDDILTLTFDNPPEDVTVSTGTAKTIGNRVRIAGPFDPGPLALTIVWADGSQTLTYTVTVPDTEAPKLISGSVNDGDKDVDPESLNLPGQIEVTFNKTVTGDIALQTTSGADVGWRGKVQGTKGTLELVSGKELGNEITYVIAGNVKDAAGNSTDINIRFTTSPKTSGIPFAVTDATFNSRVLGSDVPVLLEYVKDG